MQINLLRQLGIARFFVATIIDMDEPAYELHAWVDVLYRELVGWV
jgi:transglutaminase-like putative cysteine protease